MPANPWREPVRTAACRHPRRCTYHRRSPLETAAIDPQELDDVNPLRFDAPPAGPHVHHVRRHLPPMLIEDPRVLAAIRVIEAGFPAEPTLAGLAAQTRLSPFHFHRLFADVMGETVNGYVRRIRMDTAAILLLASPLAAQDVAAAVGYGSLAAFNHAFRRQFGLPPTRYRELARAAVIDITPDDLQRARRVRVETQLPLSLVGARFHGSYDQAEDYWLRFAALLRNHGIEPDGLAAYALIRDNPEITPNGLIRYFCMVADPGLADPLPAPLERFSVPAGRYACLRHDGPYAGIFPVYFAISPVWLQKHGQRFGMSPALERYESPPWRHAGGEQSVTVMIKLL
jgi:AraC family transcriptional regulator